MFMQQPGMEQQAQQQPQQLFSPFSEAMRMGLTEGSFGQFGNEQFRNRYAPRQIAEPEFSPFAQMMQGGMLGGQSPGGPMPGGPMPGGPRRGGPMPGGPMPGGPRPGGPMPGSVMPGGQPKPQQTPGAPQYRVMGRPF